MIVEGGQTDRDRGFTLIEALVVLAISAMLMSVLTQMLIFSQDSNQRLESHFAESQEARFFDVQLQAVMDRVWIDPLFFSGQWQPSSQTMRSPARDIRLTRRDREGLPFQGNEDEVTFFAYDPFTIEGEIIAITLSWVETDDRPDQRFVRLESEAYDIVWPAPFPMDARFAYTTFDTGLSLSWPPERDPKWQEDPYLRVLGPMPAPKAVHIVVPDGRRPRSLHVFDLRV